MPTANSIATILTIAKISQYLAANQVAQDLYTRGTSNDLGLAQKIYEERKSLELLYELDPTSTSLVGPANYLYALCGKFALAAQTIISNLAIAAPVVTGPASATVLEGATATFTLSITSSITTTIVWYKNGVEIAGETAAILSITAALEDSGALYSAIVTSAAGSTGSAIATLTVTASVIGSYYVGDTNYFAALNAGTDSISYLGTFPIVSGSPLSVTLPSTAGNNKYIVIKYPASQGAKTTWYSTDLDSGNIPDSAMQAIVTIGSYKYVISRVAMSLDVTAPLIIS